MGSGCAPSCTLSSVSAEKDLERGRGEFCLGTAWRGGGAVAHTIFLGGVTPSFHTLLHLTLSSLLRDGRRRELGPWVLGGSCRIFCLGSLFSSLLPNITPNQVGNVQRSCLHPDRQAG